MSFVPFEPVENGSEFPKRSFVFDSVTGTEEVGSPPKNPNSLSLAAEFEPIPLNISFVVAAAALDPGPVGKLGNLYFSI